MTGVIKVTKQKNGPDGEDIRLSWLPYVSRWWSVRRPRTRSRRLSPWSPAGPRTTSAWRGSYGEIWHDTDGATKAEVKAALKGTLSSSSPRQGPVTGVLRRLGALTVRATWRRAAPSPSSCSTRRDLGPRVHADAAGAHARRTVRPRPSRAIRLRVRRHRIRDLDHLSDGSSDLIGPHRIIAGQRVRRPLYPIGPGALSDIRSDGPYRGPDIGHPHFHQPNNQENNTVKSTYNNVIPAALGTKVSVQRAPGDLSRDHP